MSPEHIRELYRYMHWANGRVREAVAPLTEEEFTRDLRSSFPSIRDTLVHMVGAEWVWLERWHGISPPALPVPAELPTREAITARWIEVERGQRDFLAGLDAAALDRPLEYTNTKGKRFAYPLRVTLLHVVNHASYHRGQITTLLRQIGARPLSTDLPLFYDAGAPAPSTASGRSG